jgi:CheY-like chemotaxis protein
MGESTKNTNFWLVVEDQEAEFLLLNRACLRLEPPPTVHWVPDGLEAQRYLAGVGEFGDRNRFPLPRLIISDLKMPRMDGFELLAWIKRQPSLSAIPFVVFTSSDLHQDRARAQELGVEAYLLKPTDSRVLVGVLEALSGAR